MITDDERRKMIANMPDDVKARAAELYDMVRSATENANKYEAMTNEELAAAVINGPWAELPVFSQYSELLDAVADRLKQDTAAREEAARLREAQRWIPVSERLPESEYPEDGESISVQGFCNAGIWDGVLSPIYYIYRTGHWYFGQSRLDTVTHWRPLPEPPTLSPAGGETE